MVHGSKTQVAKEENIRKLEILELKRINWMCNASVRQGRYSDELRDHLGLIIIKRLLTGVA